jgi:hypothetical protein
VQQVLFHGTVIGALVYFLWTTRVAPRRSKIYWELLVPLLFFLLFPVSYLIARLLWTRPLLLVSTALYVALGLLYCFGPYIPRATRGTMGVCVDPSLRPSFAPMTQGGRTDQC